MDHIDAIENHCFFAAVDFRIGEGIVDFRRMQGDGEIRIFQQHRTGPVHARLDFLVGIIDVIRHTEPSDSSVQQIYAQICKRPAGKSERENVRFFAG
ncbi:hypothetical protein SDC9_127408 [bioreactor metagenome]|uniref:Uncharacterized protein n=1 Tax=bioreactor metagenome TaxID=1076179 RepID=A0A645CTX5_9ZZZZ